MFMISTLLKNITLSIIPLLLVQCGTTDIPRYYRYNDIFESKFFQKEWEVIFDYKNDDIHQMFLHLKTQNCLHLLKNIINILMMF